MKLENLEKVASLKRQLENYEKMLDVILISGYLKRIYQKKRDEVISELKELGVEV